MGSSCSIIGRCRDRKTKQYTNKLSKLHRDLLDIKQYVSNFDRREANRAFLLSQTDKFIDDYKDDIIWDSDALDAEPKLASFYEIAKEIMPEVKTSDIRDVLAKKFGEGVYSYQDAYNKMLNFNKEMEGAHTFMGTIEATKDGKYKFRIAYNAREEQDALIKTVATREAAETLLKKLENLGVTAGEGLQSLYSTEDPKVIVRGAQELLRLIEVNGGIDNIHEFADEVGHFIVGALGKNSPLYQRLWNSIENNPEIMRELLGDAEYEAYSKTSNATREFMGHLVGKYLEKLTTARKQHKVGQQYNNFKRLITKVFEWVKSRIHITNRDYWKAMYDAKFNAYNMAKQFLGENFKGNLDNALSTKETLYAEKGRIIETIIEQLQKLEVTYATIRDDDKEVAKNLNALLQKVLTDTRQANAKIKKLESEPSASIFKLNQARQQLIEAEKQLVSEVFNMLSKSFKDLQDINKKIGKDGEPVSFKQQAKTIKQLSELLDLSNKIIGGQETIINFCKQIGIDTNNITTAIGDLSSLIKKPLANSEKENEQTSTLFDIIQDARCDMAFRLLTQCNGNEFIAIAAHTGLEVFGKQNGKRTIFHLNRHKAETVNIQKLLKDTVNDPPGQWFSRFITGMVDNPSITDQLITQLTEQQLHITNRNIIDMKDRLRNEYYKLRSIVGAKDKVISEITNDYTRRFYEVDEKGNLTGNLISERNWGAWEACYKEESTQFKDEWFEAHKEEYHGHKSEMYQDFAFTQKFDEWRTGWHSFHSSYISERDENGEPIKDETGKVIKHWVPALSSDENCTASITYESKQWQEFQDKSSPELIEWYKNFIKLKRELDSMLPNGATNYFGLRAPQFRGKSMNKLQNIIAGSAKVNKIMGMSIQNFIDSVSLTPEDTNFGGEHNTYDEDVDAADEIIYTKDVINDLNLIDRLPVYGVKKLKRMEELSTDLFSSTLAYASMAYKYNNLNDIADALVQLKEFQAYNKYGSTMSISQRESKGYPTPASYHRLTDYLHQQVFNNYTRKDNKLSSKLFRKWLNWFSKMSSVWFLGLNFASACTNTMTAFAEMFKEALSGEEYTLKDFIATQGVYIKYQIISIFSNFANVAVRPGSDLESYNKMQLFLRMFDADNDVARKSADWGLQKRAHGTPISGFTDFVMWPYSATDKWMQACAFLGCARHTKLRKTQSEKGQIISQEEVSLWDAYTVKNGKLVLNGDKNTIWEIKDRNTSQVQKILKEKYADTSDMVWEDQLNDPKNSDKVKELTPEIKVFFRRQSYIDFTGKEINSWVRKSDSELEEEQYSLWDNRQETLFKTRCRGINNRMHGVYNSSDGGAYLTYALGGPIAALKKYAIGLIDRRFSSARYDIRSGDIRQGSYVTMANLLVDCFSKYNAMPDIENENVSGVKAFFNNLDKMSYLGKSNINVFQAAFKTLYGILKFMAITTSGGWIGQSYLKQRGFSKNQIANITKFWGDMIMPFIIQLAMHICCPPDEEDDLDEQTQREEEEPSKLEQQITKMFLQALNLAPINKTANDDYYLDPEIYSENIKKYNHGAPAFSIKGILYYQLYRMYTEQQSYNLLSPTGVFTEFQGLLSTSLPLINALADVASLGVELLEPMGITNKSQEELDDMAERGDKDYKKYDYDTGVQIYQRGKNEGWYKYTKHLLKVGPLRTLNTWQAGYAATDDYKYFKNVPLDFITQLWNSTSKSQSSEEENMTKFNFIDWLTGSSTEFTRGR